MRAQEFLIEDTAPAQPDVKFLDALQDWIGMEETVASVNTILSSKEAEPFKQPPAGIRWLFRAIVPKDTGTNSIKSSSQIIAFATKMAGAHEFIRSLDIHDRYVIVRYEFHAQDFVLNFSGLYETYTEERYNYISEHEVWMKNTPYYRKTPRSEIVYDSAKDW